MKYLITTILFIFIATISQAKDVTLSWDPSPTESVTGYTLYWDNQETPPFSNSVDCGLVLTQVVANLPDNEDHWFAVTAHDGLGNESVYSNIVKSDKITPVLPELDLDINWEFIEGR